MREKFLRIAKFVMIMYAFAFLFQLNVYADNAYGNFSYKIMNGSAIITAYNGSENDVRIPEKIGNYKVTGIADKVFSEIPYIKSVTIPDSITNWGSQVFSDCTNLKNVRISDSLIAKININEQFCDTNWLDYYKTIGTNYKKAFHFIQKYVKPDSYVGNYYATLNNTLTSAQYNELKTAASTAVTGCTTDYEKARALYAFVATKMYYDYPRRIGYADPDYTGENATYYAWKKKRGVCEDYAEILQVFCASQGIPILKIIGFDHAYNAIYIKDDGNARWIFADATWGSGNSYDKVGGKATWEKGEMNYTHFDMNPAYISSLDSHEVYNFENFTTDGSNYYYDFNGDDWKHPNNWYLTIMSRKKKTEKATIGGKIGDIPVSGLDTDAFLNDKTLKELIIGKEIVEIGESCFNSCTNLTKITFPGTLKSIGDSAFHMCSSLKTVVLPKGLKTIGDSAFLNCYKLSSITIPNTVTSIGDSAFNFTNLTTLLIPNSVKSIGQDAFSNCYNLKTAILPGSITSMGYSVFNTDELLVFTTKGSYADKYLKDYYAITVKHISKTKMKALTSLSGSSACYWIISKSSMKLNLGSSGRLNNYYSVFGSSKETYSSSNSKIATVSSSGRVTAKKIGTCKITVKSVPITGYVSNKKTFTIHVHPKKVTLRKLTPSRNQLKVTYKKTPGGVSYEIQYSQYKNFKKATSKKTKATSFTLTKLGKNTTYYVRVRAYKKVGTKTYYGNWSKPLKKMTK